MFCLLIVKYLLIVQSVDPMEEARKYLAAAAARTRQVAAPESHPSASLPQRKQSQKGEGASGIGDLWGLFETLYGLVD